MNHNRIFILGILLEKERNVLKQELSKEMIYSDEKLCTENIIEYIKKQINLMESEDITICLISNLLNNNEQIFKFKRTKQSLEDLINLLNQQSYNKNKIFVNFNKETIFANYGLDKNKTYDNIISIFREWAKEHKLQ